MSAISPVEFTTPTATLRGWQSGDNATTLALHGWLDNANTWTTLAPYLPPIIALDVRGHGHSSWGHGPYHFWDSVADLLAVVERIGEPVDLIGHSMGAGIVTLFAGCFPEHVKSLALVEGYGPWLEQTLSTRAQLRRCAEVSQADFREARPFASVDIACRVRSKHGVSPVSETAIRPVVERNLREHDEGWTWRYDPWLTRPSPLRMDAQQVHDVMRAIECPTRLVLASRGMLNDSPMLQERLGWRHVEQLTLAGNHHLHLYPENAPAIASFWAPLWG